MSELLDLNLVEASKALKNKKITSLAVSYTHLRAHETS